MDAAGIEELTCRACDAARQGRWDLVGQLYGEREPMLVTAPLLSIEERQRIEAMDRDVQERATVAREALAAAMRETSLNRQLLEGIRRRVGAEPREPGAIRLQA